MIIDLVKPLSPGYYNLSISYGSVMRKDLMGCYMSFEKDKDGNEVPFITSQFEPNYARTCIPTFDEPDIKMIFDVTVSVPNSMDLYFNTEPLTSEIVTNVSDDQSSSSLCYSFIRFV